MTSQRPSPPNAARSRPGRGQAPLTKLDGLRQGLVQAGPMLTPAYWAARHGPRAPSTRLSRLAARLVKARLRHHLRGMPLVAGLDLVALVKALSHAPAVMPLHELQHALGSVLGPWIA
jgi:hypothetical protein